MHPSIYLYMMYMVVYPHLSIYLYIMYIVLHAIKPPFLDGRNVLSKQVPK